MSSPSQKRFLRFANVAWGLGYVLMLCVLIWQLFAVKESMLAKLSTPKAQADWDQWRAETAKPGPVARRVPKSDEPPLLVLLRDYFGTCLSVALFFCSLLYAVLMLLIRGAFNHNTTANTE